MSEWYYAHGGEQKGPVPVSELQRLADNGEFDPSVDLVWREGMEDWKPASTVGELQSNFHRAAPASPAEAPASPAFAPSDTRAPAAPAELNPYAAPVSDPSMAVSADGRLPQVKPVNYGLMVGLMVLGFFGLMAGYGWLLASSGLMEGAETVSEVPAGPLALIMLSLIPLMIGGILSLICLYRAWVLLQPHTPHSTPGKAVGFLFIPLFNFYWIFVAYWRWSQEWNRVVANNPGHPQAPRMNEGLFLTYAILNVCGIIPVVGTLVGVAALVVFFVILKGMADAVNYAAVR